MKLLTALWAALLFSVVAADDAQICMERATCNEEEAIILLQTGMLQTEQESRSFVQPEAIEVFGDLPESSAPAPYPPALPKGILFQNRVVYFRIL